MTARKLAEKVAKKITENPAKRARKTAVTKAARPVPGTTASDILAGSPAANPPGFSNPATRALRNIGVTRLSQLTEHRESDVAGVHGVGPKGVKVLKAALTAQGLSLRA